uniref:Histone-lysine N-methyltransferase n=1 Tax=Strongyloides papillosus TaxID=174720 RepID=A0A0N5BXX3_STREA
MSDNNNYEEDTRKRCKEIIEALKCKPPERLDDDKEKTKKESRISLVKTPPKLKNNKKKPMSSDMYNVEAIVQCTPDQKKFLVKWENYSWSESTWEPYRNIKHCEEDLNFFRDREKVLSQIESYRSLDNKITMINESGVKCMQFMHCKQLEIDILESSKDEAPIYVFNALDNDRVPEFKYISTTIIRPFYANYIGLLDNIKSCDICYAESSDEWCEKAKEYINSMINTFPFKFFTVCNNKCNCVRNPCPTTTRYKRKYKLIITKTKNKSWGLFAGETIKKGDFICKCAGKLILRSEIDSKNKGYIYDINYLSGNLNTINDEEFCYDLAEFANESRFINHSCDPNCSIVPSYYGFRNINFYEIIFIANQDIPFNTEITFDYFGNRTNSDDGCTVKCYCGASNCRGFLPSNNGLVGDCWLNDEILEKKVVVKLSQYLKEVNYKDSS